MIYIRAQLIDQMTRHAQFLRSTLVRNPSPEQLALWRFNDLKEAKLRELLLQNEEDDGAFNVHITSEVKRK